MSAGICGCGRPRSPRRACPRPHEIGNRHRRPLARISHQSVTRTEPEPPEWVYCAARAGNTAEAWSSHVAQGVFEHAAQMPAMAAPVTGEGRIGEKCGLGGACGRTPQRAWYVRASDA